MEKRNDHDTTQEKTAAAAAGKIIDTTDNQEVISGETAAGGGFDVRVIIGRIQMASALGDFCHAIGAMQLKEIRDNKLYRQLKGRQGLDRRGNPIEDLGTWEGFCRCVGISRAKADEDIQNVERFGPELMEKMQMAGIGRDSLRKLRKLPEQELMEIEGRVVNARDKNEVVELIEDIIEHKQELAAECRALEKEVRREAILRERAELELEQIRELLREEGTGPDKMSRPALYIREESTVMGLLARDALGRMEPLLEKLASPTEAKLEPGSFGYAAAARTFWVNIQAVQAEASRLMGLFLERLGEDFVVRGMQDEPVLGFDEAERALSRARMLIAEVEGRALARKNASSEPVKRRPGRPKGSKNKRKD